MPALPAVDSFVGWAGAGFQLAGIALLLLGVSQVRSWLERTGDVSRAARKGVRQQVELSLERARHWYATRRGRPFHMVRHVGDSIEISTSVTSTVSRAGPHPENLSDHDRLAAVETRVYGVQLQVDGVQNELAGDRGAHARLAEDLRKEMVDATRSGSQFIMAGLLVSAVGILLGAFA